MDYSITLWTDIPINPPVAHHPSAPCSSHDPSVPTHPRFPFERVRVVRIPATPAPTSANVDVPIPAPLLIDRPRPISLRAPRPTPSQPPAATPTGQRPAAPSPAAEPTSDNTPPPYTDNGREPGIAHLTYEALAERIAELQADVVASHRESTAAQEALKASQMATAEAKARLAVLERRAELKQNRRSWQLWK